MNNPLAQLVDYDNDSDTSEEQPTYTSPPKSISHSTKTGPTNTAKPQEHIDHPDPKEKQSENICANNAEEPEPQPPEPQIHIDSKMAELLTPKPIPNIPNWGIKDAPDPSTEQGKCDPQLQHKFETWYEKRNHGSYFNAQLLQNKQFRNPNIYSKLVEHLELDQTGSNFDPSVFDPKGFPQELYIDQLIKAQNRLEAKRFENQKSGKRHNIQFRSSQQDTKSYGNTSNVSGGGGGGLPKSSTTANIDHEAIIQKARAVASSLNSKLQQQQQQQQPRKSKWDMTKP